MISSTLDALTAPPKAASSALDRLRAKTAAVPPSRATVKKKAMAKKKEAFNFTWSWNAFIGPKDTDDPSSPYYVPPKPKEETEEKEPDEPGGSWLRDAGDLNLSTTPKSGADDGGLSTARSGSSYATSLVWGGKRAVASPTSASVRTPTVIAKAMSKASVSIPWGYAAHLKRMYFKKKADAVADMPVREHEKLVLPSEYKKKMVDTSVPRYMRFKTQVKLPTFLEGIESAAAPMKPVKDSDSDDSEDEAEMTNEQRLWKRAQRQQKQRQEAFARRSRRLPDIKAERAAKSVQQLRNKRATASDVYDALADKDAPLADRDYQRLLDERKERSKLKKATMAARKGGNTVLKADLLMQGLHKSRTDGQRRYLKQLEAEKVRASKNEAALKIQGMWKGFKARLAWEYFSSMTASVAESVIRSTDASEQLQYMRQGRKQRNARRAQVVAARPESPPSPEATTDSLLGRLKARKELRFEKRHPRRLVAKENSLRAKGVPLSGSDYLIDPDALDLLRAAAVDTLKQKHKAARKAAKVTSILKEDISR